MVNGNSFRAKSSVKRSQAPRTWKNKKDFSKDKGNRGKDNYKSGSLSNFLNVSSTSEWGVTEFKGGFNAADKIKSTAQWNISQAQKTNEIFTSIPLDDSNSNTNPVNPESADNSIKKPKKLSAYKRAMETFKTKKEKAAEEKRAHAQQLLAKKQKREGDIQKRKANFKIFSKKNKHGQPVMAGRIQQMLEKIQSSN